MLFFFSFSQKCQVHVSFSPTLTDERIREEAANLKRADLKAMRMRAQAEAAAQAAEEAAAAAAVSVFHYVYVNS